MAISRVGSASAETTSVTLPTHQAGDLLVICAYRDGSNTAPSLPAGYTSIVSAGANTNSMRVGYKYATGAGTSSGTWTNATEIVAVVYRGAAGAVGYAPDQDTAASTSVNYPAIGLQRTDGTSWVLGFAGHRSINTTLETPPAGMSLVKSQAGATAEAVAHDTNAAVSSWAGASVSVGGTSSGWRSAVIEILEYRLAQTLTDDHDDNSLASPPWESGTVGAGSTFSESSQQINEAPAASTADAESYLVGFSFNPIYDLTGSYFFSNLKQALNASADAYTYLWVILDDNNSVRLQVNGTTRALAALKIVAGVETSIASATYNSTTHAWLRIRESGGTTFFDYSSDGSSWTNLTSLANPFAMTAVYPKESAYAAVVASPGTAIWDSFNTAPAASNVTVTPGVLALTLATFAPVIQHKINTGLATLTLATFAPTIVLGTLAVPGLATLTLTTFAPTVLAPRLVTPGLVTLTVAGFAPGANLTIITQVTNLTFTGLIPVLGSQVSVPLATLSISAFAPVVTATNHKLVTPDLLTLVVATFVPTVGQTLHQLVTPDIAVLILTTFVPLALGDHFAPNPGTGPGDFDPTAGTTPGSFTPNAGTTSGWVVSDPIDQTDLEPQESVMGSFTPQP